MGRCLFGVYFVLFRRYLPNICLLSAKFLLWILGVAPSTLSPYAKSFWRAFKKKKTHKKNRFDYDIRVYSPNQVPLDCDGPSVRLSLLDLFHLGDLLCQPCNQQCFYSFKRYVSNQKEKKEKRSTRKRKRGGHRLNTFISISFPLDCYLLYNIGLNSATKILGKVFCALSPNFNLGYCLLTLLNFVSPTPRLGRSWLHMDVLGFPCLMLLLHAVFWYATFLLV